MLPIGCCCCCPDGNQLVGVSCAWVQTVKPQTEDRDVHKARGPRRFGNYALLRVPTDLVISTRANQISILVRNAKVPISIHRVCVKKPI